MKLVYLIVSIGLIFCYTNVTFAKSTHKHTKKTSVHKVYSNKIAKPAGSKKAVAKTRQRPVKKVPVRTVSEEVAAVRGSYLGNQLNYIINSVAAESNANIGVYVKSMRHGDQLYARNIYKPLTPASTLKVLTAEAALLFLKPEYRFSTKLLTDAQTIKDGVLQGNLYVVLGGDPSLTYNDLVDLLLNLRAQEITGISGNVYIDNTAYDQNYYGPDWVYKDKGYCYAAPISASIINHNCLPFTVTPGKAPGQSAHIETYPNFFYPPIKNYVVTKPYHSSCGVHLSSDLGSGLEIDGCMPKGKDGWGVSYVVTDVPEYSRALFKGALANMGIKVGGNVAFAAAPKNPSMIAHHASEPLSDLIMDMLKKSDNVIAGALFKKLGQLYTSKPGSWQNGSYAVSQILSRTAGVNTFGLKILDGSGLSPSNQTSPSQLMQVLDFAFHHATTNDAFISALPIAGVDGTLKHRLGNIARKVRAKTGTISGVVSLAGYVMTADNEILAFVIMVNGNKGMTWKYKEMEDKIATTLARYRR